MSGNGVLTRKYSGKCHCGRVGFEVVASLDDVLVCTCSICTLKAYLHLIVEGAQFSLLSGAADLAEYRFGTGVARHLFCRHCGISPFYVPRSDPDKIDVNARCLLGVDIGALKTKVFDGQNWEEAARDRLSARGLASRQRP